MNNLEDIPNNPFTPHHPVTSDNFIGRQEDVIKILRYLPRVLNQGLPEHFFVTGNRGMGKTSFVRYVSEIAEDEYNMFPVYVNNEGTNTILELITKLCDKLFKEFKKTSWGRSFIEVFFNRIEGIKISEFGFKFRDHPEIAENIKNNFIEFLVEICDNLDDDINGLFFIIDDINGLSETPEFTNWYKGLFETLEFYNEFVPATFTLVTYPAKFDQLCEQNPSFSRMFNLIDIGRLSDGEIKEFFINTFENSNIMIENEDFIDEMVYYSWGMPLVMQQIGDAIFWNIEGNIITDEIVYNGIRDAALELKNKPLKNILNNIKNPYYLNILFKLGEYKKFNFKKSEIASLLTDKEKNFLDSFIDEMLLVNIFEITDFENKEFKFSNIAYFVYFLITSTFRQL